MNAKLTLTVDKAIIEAAKKYAKSNGRSLSNIIEEYLKSLVHSKTDNSEFEISPLVQSLWGSVKPLPKSMDYKEILAEELAKKYLK
ncbi:MAG TPA: hypothetical protein ENJ95_09475 [Bacteroidetes bacterium]|nr:hypothetical protein [Bacteroidota bacterium]